MKFLYLPVFFLLTLFACNKSNSEQTNIVFSGITSTDESGNFLSQDTSDWRFDRTWSDKEIGLFSSILKTSLNCSVPKEYLMTAFPNPCKESVFINALKNTDTKIEVRLVDADFNILMKNDTILNTNSLFQVNLSNLQKKGMLRLYYRFIKGDCEYRGHGDILAQ